MPPKCMSCNYSPVMMKYAILHKLPGIGEDIFLQKLYWQNSSNQIKMLTDVISRHTKQEDKDEYSSTYRTHYMRRTVDLCKMIFKSTVKKSLFTKHRKIQLWSQSKIYKNSWCNKSSRNVREVLKVKGKEEKDFYLQKW